MNYSHCIVFHLYVCYLEFIYHMCNICIICNICNICNIPAICIDPESGWRSHSDRPSYIIFNSSQREMLFHHRGQLRLLYDYL